MVRKGRVEPEGRALSSPVAMAWEKDRSWKLRVDYHRLNAVTRQYAYPLHRMRSMP